MKRFFSEAPGVIRASLVLPAVVLSVGFPLAARAQIALPSAAAVPVAVSVEGGQHGPAGVAFGPDGKVFIAQAYEDGGNTHGPVLVYASLAALQASPNAPLAILGGAAQAGNPQGFIYNPEAVAVDSAGNLFVADTQGNRVLMFKPPFATGMNASAVLGQANFNDNQPGAALNQMNFPRGLGFDSAGNLLVADDYNGRVLRFARSGNAAQPFVTHQSPDSAVTIPNGKENTKAVAMWGNDFLVSSYFNQRFYLYRRNGAGYVKDAKELNPPGKAIDLAVLSAPAHGASDYPRVVVSIHDPHKLLGYEPAGWATNTPAQTYLAPTGINTPLGVALNAGGDMVLANYGNSRLLVWKATPGGGGGGGGGGASISSAIASWGNDFDAKTKLISTKPAGNDFIAIGAGYGTGYAVHADGSLAAWGLNDRGQVSSLPTGTGYTQVAGSEYQGYGLKSDGSITTWGDTQFAMYVAPAGTGFKSIAAAMVNGAALKTDGSIVVWGDNTHKQISNVPAGGGYKQVAVGYGVCYALTADGTIKAWGRDDQQQVTNTPAGSGFKFITTAFYTGFALRADGSIAVWGNNHYGQITSVPAGGGFTKIAVGSGIVCALRADGSVAVWATNGTINAPAGNGYTQLAAAATSGFALKSPSQNLLPFPRPRPRPFPRPLPPTRRLPR